MNALKTLIATYIFFNTFAEFAQEKTPEYKIIVDVGSSISARSLSILKTSQMLDGDGLLESVKSTAPKELEENLIVILEKAESNGFLTKYDITYTILYGSKKIVCEKNIETGFFPGGSYTINRPKVAFESTVKSCLIDFFDK